MNCTGSTSFDCGWGAIISILTFVLLFLVGWSVVRSAELDLELGECDETIKYQLDIPPSISKLSVVENRYPHPMDRPIQQRHHVSGRNAWNSIQKTYPNWQHRKVNGPFLRFWCWLFDSDCWTADWSYELPMLACQQLDSIEHLQTIAKDLLLEIISDFRIRITVVTEVMQNLIISCADIALCSLVPRTHVKCSR